MAENESGVGGSGSCAFRGRGSTNIKGNMTDIGRIYVTYVFDDAKIVKCRYF